MLTENDHIPAEAGFSKVSDAPCTLRCHTHRALLDRLNDRVALYSASGTDRQALDENPVGGQFELHRSPDLPFWGQQEIRFFAPNLGVVISDYSIEEEFDYEFVYENLGFVQFRLDGVAREPHSPHETTVTAGRPGFKISMAPAGHVDHIHYLPAARWRTVTAFFDEAAIRDILAPDDAAGDDAIAALAKWKQQFGTSLHPMAVSMLDTARAVMQCGYTGSLRKTYLQAKTVELLCLLLGVIDEVLADREKLPLTRQDRQKLHSARDILDTHFIHPPTLAELGRMVGLNRRKLATGYKYLFRKTVYQYCLEKRMEQARTLLQKRQPVSLVAEATGYADQSSFSRAFSQFHGSNPRYFQSG